MAAPSANVIQIEAGPGAPKQAQAAMINAKPGDVIEFGTGRFEFRSTLSLDVSGVVVRGQGPDQTILSFKEQGAGTGGEGILITSQDNVTLEDLAVEDARGTPSRPRGPEESLSATSAPSGREVPRKPMEAMASTRSSARTS